MDISFAIVETQNDLAWCLDDLIDGVNKMLSKTGRHGQSSEIMISTMIKLVGTPFSFLLLAYDEKRVFQGFCYAVLVKSQPSWVDFMGVYTKPGVASRVKNEAFSLLKGWARSQGASVIMAGITRHHETFFRFFHEPLGFRKIGVIVEYDLTKEGENGRSESRSATSRRRSNSVRSRSDAGSNIRPAAANATGNTESGPP